MLSLYEGCIGCKITPSPSSNYMMIFDLPEEQYEHKRKFPTKSIKYHVTVPLMGTDVMHHNLCHQSS